MFLISPTCSYIRISHISIFMQQLLRKNGKKRAWSLYIFNRIGGVMVSVFTSSAVNRWIEPRSVKLEMNYFIGTPGSPLCFELLIELVSESGWRRNFITKEILNFPFKVFCIYSNIPTGAAYGVYIFHFSVAIFQSLWFLPGISWQSVATNKGSYWTNGS